MPSKDTALTRARDYLVLHAVGVGSFLAVLGVLLLPRRLAFHGPSLCLFHRLSGLPCPGCGLTRSLWSVAHGEVVASFAWHPLGVVVLLLLCLWAVDSFPIRRPAWKRFMLWSQGGIFVALVVAWVVRLALGQTPDL